MSQDRINLNIGQISKDENLDEEDEEDKELTSRSVDLSDKIMLYIASQDERDIRVCLLALTHLMKSLCFSCNMDKEGFQETMEGLIMDYEVYIRQADEYTGR